MALLSVKDAFYGGLIYCSGDTIAMLIGSDYQFSRMLGMALLGSTLYAIEIPAYFRWLARRFSGRGIGQALARMLLAAAFFNPLWIARHIVFINLFSGAWRDISFAIFPLALSSFCFSLPATLPANYVIQNYIGLDWRFFASSLFSALMAIYFSLSEVLFA
ncbi:hypothetical protein [Methylomarinum vadi]|uniref:hypothetical protein n=1 Tax=Methylomarinum vadi TaxID=438855 RepID=UPI0004DF4891|nr:hypothetical protein [Methylomarinum vadi]